MSSRRSARISAPLDTRSRDANCACSLRSAGSLLLSLFKASIAAWHSPLILSSSILASSACLSSSLLLSASSLRASSRFLRSCSRRSCSAANLAAMRAASFASLASLASFSFCASFAFLSSSATRSFSAKMRSSSAFSAAARCCSAAAISSCAFSSSVFSPFSPATTLSDASNSTSRVCSLATSCESPSPDRSSSIGPLSPAAPVKLPGVSGARPESKLSIDSDNESALLTTAEGSEASFAPFRGRGLAGTAPDSSSAASVSSGGTSNGCSSTACVSGFEGRRRRGKARGVRAGLPSSLKEWRELLDTLDSAETAPSFLSSCKNSSPATTHDLADTGREELGRTPEVGRDAGLMSSTGGSSRSGLLSNSSVGTSLAAEELLLAFCVPV
mmetsp:Transcript_23001/g.57593  ORF Transcript_23001/g.57593 Transcript_23001/m.57593 type:complete len:388 (-) Transcript_23001:916-2079(-)